MTNTANMTEIDKQQADREKSTVAFSSILAAVFLTGLKLVVGLTTGSLGILSEAAHSGLDLVAAGVTFVAVRVSGQPADGEHTYGHGKVENLSALFETLLLLVTCVWIFYEAGQRLFFEHVAVEVSIWAFVVMGISIVVDITRSRALSRAAKKHKSQALEADALHFSTDIWSSSVVILGLILVYLSDLLRIPWLARADALAAIGVACIVVYVSLRMGRKTVEDLLDAVPPGLRDEVAEAVRQVPGVLELEQLRIRRSGPESFADVTLSVARDLPLQSADELADKVEETVRNILPGADVIVHTDPVRSATESVISTVRLLAARYGMSAHNIHVHDAPRRRRGRRALDVELHLEVDNSLQVAQAHRLVSDFENAVHHTLPQVDQVVSHIEPEMVPEKTVTRPASPDDIALVEKALQAWQSENPSACFPHEVRVQRTDQGLLVTLHCAVGGDVPLVRAHSLTEDMEQALRSRLPDLWQVVIHAEPTNS